MSKRDTGTDYRELLESLGFRTLLVKEKNGSCKASYWIGPKDYSLGLFGSAGDHEINLLFHHLLLDCVIREGVIEGHLGNSPTYGLTRNGVTYGGVLKNGE